jgi:PAS domain S-box-containing protein
MKRGISHQEQKTPAVAAELRRRAEGTLRKRRRKKRADTTGRASPADAQRLLHELQVHQIELEMQNAELQKARDETETLLEKYTDLYDSAPAGYFSLDEQGRIIEVNLKGAALLGTARSRLIRQHLVRFMVPVSQPIFQAFLKEVFIGTGEQVCESKILMADGTTLWADLHGSAVTSPSSPSKWCRMIVSDVTALKRATEAQSRMEALAAANLELEREIVQRRAAEQSLKISEQHLNQSLEQSRHLAHQILSAHEEERKEISRELHDQLVQTLVGINMRLAALQAETALDPKRLSKRIDRTRRLVEKSVNIVHRFARELRPAMLDDMGLVPALNSYLKEFMKRSGIRVRFTAFASAKIEQLGSEMRAVLYRVAQSALNNSAQHAQASRVNVILQKIPGAICMEIKDDGTGFDVERVLLAKRHKRLGLPIMKERVEMVGGSFAVESVHGKGTTIRAQIPFNDGVRQE